VQQIIDLLIVSILPGPVLSMNGSLLVVENIGRMVGKYDEIQINTLSDTGIPPHLNKKVTIEL
jgi:hypothetical protein